MEPADQESSLTKNDEFYKYYEKQSVTESTRKRFEGIYETVIRVRRQYNLPDSGLTVADIGCGAGTQSIMWAQDGHHVHGLDINEGLIKLAKQRATDMDVDVKFSAESATKLPWSDESIDVCLVPELLEHVVEWEQCVDEFCRILRPGGILFITTSSYLCPKQYEFELPMYGWYPGFLKRYYEKLAVTTRPELVCHAEYPAVNWFSFYSLRRAFKSKGFDSLDRFDIMDLESRGLLGKFILLSIRKIGLIRWLAHVATPYTTVLAIKNNS